jgi:putative Holliday junction resolvase
MRVMALDFGSARTGVALSDPTGTLATPLCVVDRAAGKDGLERLAALAREHGVDVVVVGMPLTLRGERGEQARATEQFVAVLERALDVPVETFDERFTTRLAGREESSATPEDARAAAHLLSGYLERMGTRP